MCRPCVLVRGFYKLSVSWCVQEVGTGDPGLRGRRLLAALTLEVISVCLLLLCSLFPLQRICFFHPHHGAYVGGLRRRGWRYLSRSCLREPPSRHGRAPCPVRARGRRGRAAVRVPTGGGHAPHERRGRSIFCVQVYQVPFRHHGGSGCLCAVQAVPRTGGSRLVSEQVATQIDVSLAAGARQSLLPRSFLAILTLG